MCCDGGDDCGRPSESIDDGFLVRVQADIHTSLTVCAGILLDNRSPIGRLVEQWKVRAFLNRVSIMY